MNGSTTRRALAATCLGLLLLALPACGGKRRRRPPPKAKPQPAAGAGWELLGERVASHRVDRDVIPVTAVEGVFERIQVRVKGRAIEVADLKVHFRNGDVQDVRVRRRIPAGGSTRAIDLEGRDRVIRKVTVIYRTRLPAGPRAHVRLFGHR